MIMKKLKYSDIGYYGKPIDTLTREELLAAILEFAEKLQECAVKDNPCRSIFTVKT